KTPHTHHHNLTDLSGDSKIEERKQEEGDFSTPAKADKEVEMQLSRDGCFRHAFSFLFHGLGFGIADCGLKAKALPLVLTFHPFSTNPQFAIRNSTKSSAKSGAA